MFKLLSAPLPWVFVNLLGIGAFLAVASMSWIEPELASVPGASGGDAFVWFGTAVPILMLFLIANLIWFTVSLRVRCSSGVTVFALGALVSVAWIAAYWFDNVHHGI